MPRTPTRLIPNTGTHASPRGSRITQRTSASPNAQAQHPMLNPEMPPPQAPDTNRSERVCVTRNHMPAHSHTRAEVGETPKRAPYNLAKPACASQPPAQVPLWPQHSQAGTHTPASPLDLLGQSNRPQPLGAPCATKPRTTSTIVQPLWNCCCCCCYSQAEQDTLQALASVRARVLPATGFTLHPLPERCATPAHKAAARRRAVGGSQLTAHSWQLRCEWPRQDRTLRPAGLSRGTTSGLNTRATKPVEVKGGWFSTHTPPAVLGSSNKGITCEMGTCVCSAHKRAAAAGCRPRPHCSCSLRKGPHKTTNPRLHATERCSNAAPTPPNPSCCNPSGAPASNSATQQCRAITALRSWCLELTVPHRPFSVSAAAHSHPPTHPQPQSRGVAAVTCSRREQDVESSLAAGSLNSPRTARRPIGACSAGALCGTQASTHTRVCVHCSLYRGSNRKYKTSRRWSKQPQALRSGRAGPGTQLLLCLGPARGQAPDKTRKASRHTTPKPTACFCGLGCCAVLCFESSMTKTQTPCQDCNTHTHTNRNTVMGTLPRSSATSAWWQRVLSAHP